VPLYGSVFVALSLVCFAVAVRTGGVSLVLLWPSAAFGVVGVAYALLAPSVLGKRPDGTFPPWRRVLFFPFFLYTECAWHLYALFAREDAYNEVAPELWVGRWPGARALPERVDVVVDVTAELPAHKTLTGSKRYVCLPALDATVPDESAFCSLVEELASERGGVFVHCAFGHGRSAMVAAAVLIARGLAHDADSAERWMRRSRPRVGLTGLQRSHVERFAARVRAPSASRT
jgi:protein-tyrosine phosphatase